MRVAAVVAAVGMASVAALGSVAVARAADTEPPKCNGSARLCDRTVGEVAFATSHNSMSSPADDFRGPNQGQPIRWQLDHGIRGFQIDAYEGVRDGKRVYTELTGPFGEQATDLPAPLVQAAVRIHRAIGAPAPGTPTSVYLCHSFCEIGAVEMQTSARELRTFLDRHPREVVVIVIEDYVPAPRILDTFGQAGLADQLLAVAPGDGLPTLGQMIDADTRLLVSLENGDGGPQLPNAFAGLVEETPFTFLSPRALDAKTSCDPERGTDAAPIFQLNHWVTPPTRRRAEAVNGPALRERVARCSDARHRIPTLVAVDFAERSDVLAVVDDLNDGRSALERP